MNPTAPPRKVPRDAPGLPPGVPAITSYRKFWAKRFGNAPFLPMSRTEMETLGWDSCDIILVTGDAYIDHPSFGMALVGRLLEAQGFRVGIISQPDWKSAEAFKALGKPNLFWGVTAGNMDSMVNRYTSDRKIRSDDAYTPDARPDKRPDRAVVVYAQRCREAYKNVPVVIGGIEASLRRIAHYDYWSDTVRRSVLPDSKADMLLYGNAERALVALAHRLAAGEPIDSIRDLRGTAFMAPPGWLPGAGWAEIDSTQVDTPGPLIRHADPYAMDSASTANGGASPFGNGAMRGISSAATDPSAAKSPLPPLLQRGEQAIHTSAFEPTDPYATDSAPTAYGGASPFEKGGMRGISTAEPNATAVKSPLPPLLQKGEQPIRLHLQKERLDRASTAVRLPAYEQVKNDPVLYAHASRTLHLESNPGNARALVQTHGERDVWLNPPPWPLTTPEMDFVYGLAYARAPHPAYGGARIPAWEMIRFSVNIMRGCFGGCTFCSITEHEGRIIQSRSEASILHEIEEIRDKTPGFTGVVSDIGGPTANMYRMACKDVKIESACRRLSCVFPDICENLNTSHAPLVELYRKARALPGIKKVLIGSGVRYDLAVKSPEYVRELVTHHVGGYLKIAPEHTEEGPLAHMMKPGMGAYERFKQMFDRFSKEAGKEQYLIPYFIAAHPGTTDRDMLNLALWLKQNGFRLDQVQTFLPTPMALATTMYHTERNPLHPLSRKKGEKVAMVKGAIQRRLHKAFLRYHDAENWPILREALKSMGRADLIGNGKRHLVPDWQPAGTGRNVPRKAAVTSEKAAAGPARLHGKPATPAAKPRIKPRNSPGGTKTGRQRP